MEIYSLNLSSFFLLSAFIFSAKSEVTQISFPQFSANDSSIRTSGDVLYNPDRYSYILNANSAATNTASCALLLYAKADLRIQDIQASFTTSFTFRFTTPPQQPVWDDFNASMLVTGTRLTFAMGNAMANQWLEAWANETGPCSIVSGYNDYVGIVFGTNYNIRTREPSNNYIGISDGNDNNPVFGVGTTYNLCGDNINHCSFLADGDSFTAWIDYTREQTLQVRLLNGSSGEKPAKPLFEYPNFELPPAMGEYISLTIIASSAENHITAHEVFAWSFNTSGVPKKVGFWHQIWVLPLGIGGTVITFLVLCVLSVRWFARSRSREGINHPSGIRVFLYKELRQATKNFSESEKIGSGGFGTVYKDFRAHLGDFGLARLMDHHKHDRTTMAAGTLGYMAPEMPYTGKATKESDIYSFGILVLEVVCGRQPLDLKAQQPEDVVLLHAVWQAQEVGTLLSMADPRLLKTLPARSEISHDYSEPMGTTQIEPNASHSHNSNDYNMLIELAAEEVEAERTIKNLLELGLMCCLPNPKARPTTGQVMQILQQINDIDNVDRVNISMPPLPKTKPLGLYSSMEFSQIAEFSQTTEFSQTAKSSQPTASSSSLGFLPITSSSGSECRYHY